jgi:hypothetical protein
MKADGGMVSYKMVWANELQLVVHACSSILPNRFSIDLKTF